MQMVRPRIKICGMTRAEDANFAVREGVDALGFIFYPKSPRCVDPLVARTIIESLPPFIDTVGVFVNATIEEIKQVSSIGLSSIQLHGSETPEYCCKLKEELPFCSIIKAFRVGNDSTAYEFSQYNAVVDAFLLDTYVKGAKGGTGEVFDWSLIRSLNLSRPVLLAGGLEPSNIEQAIRSTQSYCFDVNSGVEVSPGVKDHGKIEQLMSIVKVIAAES